MNDPADITQAEQHAYEEAVAQQPQNIQTGPVPSPEDKPKSCPELSSLSGDEYNKILRETLAYFRNKKVIVPDGRKGEVIGIDPRPMKGVPTSPGSDGNYLCIRVMKPHAKPGRDPGENVYYMPDDLKLVEVINKDLKT